MTYIFRNDLSYLFKKRKKFLILLFLIPGMILSIQLLSHALPRRIFYMMFGLNLQWDQSLPIEILAYLFQIVMYVFIMVDLFMKDIKGQLGNIFLRMKPVVWTISKTTFLFLFVIGLQIVVFGLTTVVLALNGTSVSIFDGINLLITDLLYLLPILSMVLLFILSSALPWFKRGIITVSFIVFIIFYPKNIVTSMPYYLVLLGLIGFSQLLCTWIIQKHYRMFMQKIGGI